MNQDPPVQGSSRSEQSGRARGGIAVVTDSSASLPVDPATGQSTDELACGRVVVLPLPVDIAERTYDEIGPELDQALTMALAMGTPVRTSRPSPGRVGEAFASLAAAGYEGIVAVHLSSRLSGTVDAAELAAGEAELPVITVDSRQTGYSLGHAVLDAAGCAAGGGSLEEVAAAARRAAGRAESLFVVPHLDQLRRGGRINAAASLIGNLLSVKPLLGIDDGAVSVRERPHSLQRALDRLLERATTAIGGEQRSRVVVHSCGNRAQGEEFAQRLQEGLSVDVPVVELPPVLAAHLGLGALGVCISPPAV